MRKAATYRGARRNYALRELKTTWSDRWYYDKHRANYQRRTILSRSPSRYHPLKDMRDYLQSIGGKMTAGARAFVSKKKTQLVSANARKGARGT